MISDILICVLTSFEIYGGLEGQNLVRNKPKQLILSQKFGKPILGAFYIVLRHPQLLSRVVFDGNLYTKMYFKLFYGLRSSSGLKIGQKRSKNWLILPPNPKIQPWCPLSCGAETSTITLYDHTYMMETNMLVCLFDMF